MARRIGSWWIRDGLDGHRAEAQGFGSLLDRLPGFDWSEDHGDDSVVEKDFVDCPSSTHCRDSVAAMIMSTSGSPHGFAVSDGYVSTVDAGSFGKTDLEVLATRACGLLEHTPDNPVGRWIPAFERLHYMLGFHTAAYSGGGQDARGAVFAGYAAALHATFAGTFDLPVREAWAEANEIVEDTDVEWAYLRAGDTYAERLQGAESTGPEADRTFYIARGSC